MERLKRLFEWCIEPAPMRALIVLQISTVIFVSGIYIVVAGGPAWVMFATSALGFAIVALAVMNIFRRIKDKFSNN